MARSGSAVGSISKFIKRSTRQVNLKWQIKGQLWHFRAVQQLALPSAGLCTRLKVKYGHLTSLLATLWVRMLQFCEMVTKSIFTGDPYLEARSAGSFVHLRDTEQISKRLASIRQNFGKLQKKLQLSSFTFPCRRSNRT